MLKKPLSRRQFLKLAAAAGAGASLGRFAPGLAYAQTGIQVADGALNPFNIANVQAEGVFFSGGFGHEYIQYAADIFAQIHEGSTMSVEGIQRVGERLRPRIIAGDPPDVIDNSGAGNLDTAALVAEGELLDLAPLMSAPALDTPGKTFAETLFPGSQADGVFDGVQRYVNIAYTVFGIWHSKTLFEEKGWTYPTTWDEMLALSDNIKAAGIAPWTYQGKYPQYMQFGVLEPMVEKIGGPDVWKAVDNLEDGAWSHPAILTSLNNMKALYDNGYIMDGTEGLTHTESQAEWLQQKAAFLPCGTWLENEMRSITPEGFDMVIEAVPADDAAKLHSVIASAGEPFMVFANGKNPEAGMEFLRCLLSKESAKWFAQNVGSIMPVVGGAEGVELSSAMTSALSVVEQAGNDILSRPSYTTWYSDLNEEAKLSMGALLTGRATAEEFVERVQEVADDVKNDPDIPKYERS
ncbi:MAG: N-acetylglucosamine/diacetylchitobiose ABC transporter substrate-binding protein [Trueperaceae bacterium]|nr:N-acetylglucosamine/diacetylchitobiose ABC transporter substrate-binding protein [Trueperaceae bacterium]